ncbi:uncharacterized protein LDX57_002353 [Aspergillus melleus]|uniref:uncharacterized protein n=1 Tax=Aspergillus melleus TaxID=138277 RepID=UPI001E8D56D4|nr:uncharacterized protein LDX57_002353 [Aspergillus melleus]KAH8424609.1 hypothetical protein LDX57_002353 [Aspergillus melleus]
MQAATTESPDLASLSMPQATRSACLGFSPNGTLPSDKQRPFAIALPYRRFGYEFVGFNPLNRSGYIIKGRYIVCNCRGDSLLSSSLHLQSTYPELSLKIGSRELSKFPEEKLPDSLS